MQLLKCDKLSNGQGRKPSLEVTCPKAALVYDTVEIRLFNCTNRSFYFCLDIYIDYLISKVNIISNTKTSKNIMCCQLK